MTFFKIDFLTRNREENDTAQIIFDKDNLSIDWGKKVGIAQSYINPAISNI